MSRTQEKSLDSAIPGAIIWLTGLSGAGKSTIAMQLYAALTQASLKVEVLDGDEVRTWLAPGLGFSQADRDLNVQRVGRVAHLLSRNGVLVIVAMISPYREIRNYLKKTTHNFVEIFINAPLEVCERRDPKGLAIVNLSKPREKSFTGLPSEERLTELNAQARCGLCVVDWKRGDIVHWFYLDGVITELYDVGVLPGATRPMA